MRNLSLCSLILLATLTIGCSKAKDRQNTIDDFKTPYLGETPPGLTAKVFAPGRVSNAYKDNSAFLSPDTKEFFFTRYGGEHKNWVLLSYKYQNGLWHKSVVMPRVGRPLLSPDGKILHLGAKFKEQTDQGWSEIKSLGKLYESMEIMRLTSSKQGTYVFDEIGLPEGDGKLRYSRLIDGKREQPKEFGEHINSGMYTAHPFIAPDESYLIWDTERIEGYGSQDLYISFRQADGTWGNAINMGNKVNSGASEGGAYVSPDGKYLFFNRNINPDNYDNVDIFWINAHVINELKQQQTKI